MKTVALLVAMAFPLAACSPAPQMLTLDQVQALVPDETLSVQVLPPPARYAAAGLALEAQGKVTIVPVAPDEARRICNGAGACAYVGLFRFCRITISTEYAGDIRAALIDHERAHCAGWPRSHPA